MKELSESQLLKLQSTFIIIKNTIDDLIRIRKKIYLYLSK
jgi:hypothetical protein